MTVKTPSPNRSRAVDPQLRPIRWAKQGHSREARLLGVLRRQLIAHVGGTPSAAQMTLIDRCAMCQVHLARLDERVFRDGELSDHAARQYLAWNNSVSRMLQALGLEAAHKPAPAPLTPREIIDRAIAAREVKGAPAEPEKD